MKIENFLKQYSVFKNFNSIPEELPDAILKDNLFYGNFSIFGHKLDDGWRIAFDIALRVATGKQVFRVQPSPTNVLYLASEKPLPVYKRYKNKYSKKKIPNLFISHFLDNNFRLYKTDQVKKLRGFIKDKNIGLVIIENFDDYFAFDRRYLERLDKLYSLKDLNVHFSCFTKEKRTKRSIEGMLKQNKFAGFSEKYQIQYKSYKQTKKGIIYNLKNVKELTNPVTYNITNKSVNYNKVQQ